jgi:hypothetical protein
MLAGWRSREEPDAAGEVRDGTGRPKLAQGRLRDAEHARNVRFGNAVGGIVSACRRCASVGVQTGRAIGKFVR